LIDRQMEALRTASELVAMRPGAAGNSANGFLSRSDAACQHWETNRPWMMNH
jgi:hypothetical protein